MVLNIIKVFVAFVPFYMLFIWIAESDAASWLARWELIIYADVLFRMKYIIF